jgi:hypothetical protein
MQIHEPTLVRFAAFERSRPAADASRGMYGEVVALELR